LYVVVDLFFAATTTMQEDGQEERIHCMVIGQAHNDISGKGGGGRGWGNTLLQGIWRRR
jgi:hypothetical protein